MFACASSHRASQRGLSAWAMGRGGLIVALCGDRLAGQSRLEKEKRAAPTVPGSGFPLKSSVPDEVRRRCSERASEIERGEVEFA